MRPFVVLGAGGHTRVVIDLIRRAGWPVLGCVGHGADPEQSLPKGVEYLGDDEIFMAQYSVDKVALANGIGSVGPITLRATLFDKMRGAGYSFPGLTHPSAIVAEDITLGDGSQLMAGAVIQTGANIGKNCIINSRASIDHDCIIGDHCHIAPGCVLSGEVTIAEKSHIGAGAVVKQGTKIGRNCVIAMGAVVTHDVADGQTVAGVPAKLM